MDPITDMLNQIYNAQMAGLASIEAPFSNLKYEIARILAENKFVDKVEKKGKKMRKIMEITLKYEDKIPAMAKFKRISKPGQRIYLGAKKIKRVRGGYGISIISTSRGLMVDKEARKQKLGGEVICEVW